MPRQRQQFRVAVAVHEVPKLLPAPIRLKHRVVESVQAEFGVLGGIAYHGCESL
ncbi:MAG: hypothetical protein K8U57_32945 [Planctomycetes bacterium]|nr:hypothetical protein [Planctomycetota bacterium]